MSSKSERWLNPTKLLDELAILHPEEIDVEAIAEYVGATVVYEELRGCGGGLVARGDRAIITADCRAPRPEQRMAVAHELAHWLLDRGESGLVPSDPWGVVVTWFDQDGYEDDVSPEHRADEWAIELLMPETMLWDDLADLTPVTFETVRDYCHRFETPLLPTAKRIVQMCASSAVLVRSRQGEEALECLRRGNSDFETWLRAAPRADTVAHELLHGLYKEAPGPVPVAADAWLSPAPIWWCTLLEDSLLTTDGEVHTLLWYSGDALGEILGVWPTALLPPKPGLEAAKSLAWCMGTQYGYYPVGWQDGELVMETREPVLQQVVIPRVEMLDEVKLRGLVAEVARQKGVAVDEVLILMMD